MAVKVALAGATGNLGPNVLQALLDAGFEVTILSRQGSNSTDSLPKHDNQKIVKVDYSDAQNLTSALQGIDVVVSNLASNAIESQKPLIDASVAAGVKRYLPSEFGSDLDHPVNKSLPVFKGKVVTREYVESKAAENPNFTYTYLENNAFLDWGLQVGFIAKPKEHKITLWDGGEHPVSLTRLSTVGKAVAGVINNLDATKNRSVYVHDTVLSFKQLTELYKSIDGQEWDAEVKTTDDSVKSGYEEMKKEQPNMGMAMVSFIMKGAFGKETNPDFSKRLDNELLGFKPMSQEELVEFLKTTL